MKFRKKSFITKKNIMWKKFDIFFFIFIIVFNTIVLLFNNSEKVFYIFDNSKNFFVDLFAILFILISIFVSSIPYIAIYFGFRYAVKIITKENTSFDVLQDIEYYREKFKGVNPATMSLLMDLELESIKDLGAMKLYYELNKVILYDKGGNAYINDSSNFKFDRSDEILLNCFINNNYDGNILDEWRRNIIFENISNGLIERKDDSKNKKKGCAFFLLIHFITLIIIGYTTINFDYFDKFYVALETIPEDNLSVLNFIISDPYYMNAVVMLFLCVIALFSNVWNFIAAIVYLFTKGHVSAKNTIKRTYEGNILTEKLYGMKKFINDFSNLDEATKNHLILWDDFLIYAVVLEENDIILSEISKTYHIDLLKYKNHN